MELISTSWTCQQCGATCIGERPWHRLCDSCLAGLQALALQSLPQTSSCPSCSGPVCPDCGDAMPLLVPVPARPDVQVPGQLLGYLLGYFTDRPEGATGDDG